MIDCANPKALIHWAMAGSSGRQLFVISLEDFLFCAASANSEAAFRAAIYAAGRVEDLRRQPRSAAAGGWNMKIDVYHHFCTTDPVLAKLLDGFTRLEKALMKQDEAIAALKTAFDAMKTAVGAGVSNIAADIKGLQDKLNTLTDLSPANQAIVEGMIADAAGIADSVQKLADIVPDAPPVEPEPQP